jgi:hypothetical protein
MRISDLKIYLCDLRVYFAFFAFKLNFSNRKGREEGAKVAKSKQRRLHQSEIRRSEIKGL